MKKQLKRKWVTYYSNDQYFQRIKIEGQIIKNKRGVK